MTYVCSARWVAKEGEEERVAAAIAKLVGPARAEPGNIVYQPHRDPEDPRVFYFYEQYVDKAAFDAHVGSGHFQEYAIGEAIPLLDSRERGFYEVWEI